MKTKFIESIVIIFYYFFLKIQFVFVKNFSHFFFSNEKFSWTLFYLYLFSWVSVQVFYFACLLEEFLLKQQVTETLPVLDVSADLFELPQGIFKRFFCYIHFLLTSNECFLSVCDYTVLQFFLTFLFWVYYIKFLAKIDNWLTGPAWWFFEKKNIFLYFFEISLVIIPKFFHVYFYKNIFIFFRTFSLYISFLLRVNFFFSSNETFRNNKMVFLVKYVLLFSWYFFISNLMFLWWVIYNNNNWLIDLSELSNFWEFYICLFILLINSFLTLIKFFHVYQTWTCIFELEGFFSNGSF